MPNLIRKRADVYDAPLIDIAFTYAKMSGRHLKVGTSRRAAEVATCLAMMVNEDEDGRTGIPKGTKARALTLEELADKKRQRAHQPLGAQLMSSHFRTVTELREDIIMAKKPTKPAAKTAPAADAVGTVENAAGKAEDSEGATEGETEGAAASDTQATGATATQTAAEKEAAKKAQRMKNLKPPAVAKDMLLFFKKHPDRTITSGSMRHRIMVEAYKTGGKTTLFELNKALGESVRSDVKTLIKLEHCVEVTADQFSKLPAHPLTFVGNTKPVKEKPAKAAPAAGDGDEQGNDQGEGAGEEALI